MKILVGLGNPGLEYADTRHNIGFWVIDRLSEKFKIPLRGRDPTCVFGQGRICGKKVLLVKPTTFMNESGRAVKRAVSELAEQKTSSGDIIIIHDEMELLLGRLKIKQGGSDAGHNGLASIRQHYGEDTVRFRLGVGRPPGRRDVSDYLLEPFAKDEKKLAQELTERACEAVECLLGQGLIVTQNRFHRSQSSADSE